MAPIRIEPPLRSLPKNTRLGLLSHAIANPLPAILIAIPWVVPTVLAVTAAVIAAAWGPDATVLTAVGTWTFALVATVLLVRRVERNAILRYIERHAGRLPRCPGCDYRIVDGTSDACSECGGPIVFRVRR